MYPLMEEHRMMRITSPAFDDGGTIPYQYTNEGGNQRPSLRFEDVPSNARSLALIVDDPDGPHGTFTHWIAFNISPTTREIAGNILVTLHQACNDYGHAEYGGPKQPSADHRFFFRLYALDEELTLPRGASRLDLEEAMLGRVIAVAECMGRFAPQGSVEIKQAAHSVSLAGGDFAPAGGLAVGLV
jgi:Raf kinase inhibitor-like YbhB/YbcL family protein